MKGIEFSGQVARLLASRIECLKERERYIIYYNIARALVLPHSVYVSVLKISIVLADSVSKSIRQNVFFFCASRSC